MVVVPQVVCGADPDSWDPATENDLGNISVAEANYAASAAALIAYGGVGLLTTFATLGAFTPAELVGMGIFGVQVLNAGWQLNQAYINYNRDWNLAYKSQKDSCGGGGKGGK